MPSILVGRLEKCWNILITFTVLIAFFSVIFYIELHMLLADSVKVLIYDRIVVDKIAPTGINVDNQFLINTPGCKIPNFNHFHPSVRYYMKLYPKVNCKTSVNTDVTTSFINVLYFHPEKLPLESYLKFSKNSNFSRSTKLPKLHEKDPSINWMDVYAASNIKCCYKYVERVTHFQGELLPNFDYIFKHSAECYNITQEKTTIHHDSIIVYCNVTDMMIYLNVHHFVIKRESTNTVMSSTQPAKAEMKSLKQRENATRASSNFRDGGKYANTKPETHHDRLNVIIFGTDSVSRLNFLRKLPKTYKYLIEKLGALEFKGFNKVDDNSFKNLMPVLIGLSQEQLQKHSCIPTVGTHMYDNCPWIWKKFKSKGYTTAYMEDSPWMGTFNLNYSGFVSPPTDYYGRPYFLASEKLIGNTPIGNSNVCQGSRFSIQVLHDFSVEFMQAFSNEPTFSFFWTSSITHDFMNAAGVADEPHEAYLKRLEETGALNRSVVFFFSDHGIRYGKFRITHIGSLEERLPFFFAIFPKWFKQRHKTAFINLKKNTESLVANFDVHETLLDILNRNYEDEQYLTSVTDISQRGLSLFKEIPKNRTCEDAGIQEHYCTCHEMKPVDRDDFAVVSGASFAMDFVNKQLESYNDCTVYTEVSVLRSEISSWSRRTNVYIYLQLKLDPGSAIIETTIRDDLQFGRQPFEVLGEMSRVDSYGNQSHCIDHEVLRKYCICKDNLY